MEDGGTDAADSDNNAHSSLCRDRLSVGQVRGDIDEGTLAHLDQLGAPGLAAARVRVLAPGQIAAGLSDRFGLLTGGLRGAPARQQTLEASLEWSYDRLDDAQRLALARLSVFAGSFELDAAEAVVAGDGIDSDDVLDLVAGLAEQSMLEVVERHGRARYRLLETIRVYERGAGTARTSLGGLTSRQQPRWAEQLEHAKCRRRPSPSQGNSYGIRGCWRGPHRGHR